MSKESDDEELADSFGGVCPPVRRGRRPGPRYAVVRSGEHGRYGLLSASGCPGRNGLFPVEAVRCRRGAFLRRQSGGEGGRTESGRNGPGALYRCAGDRAVPPQDAADVRNPYCAAGRDHLLYRQALLAGNQYTHTGQSWARPVASEGRAGTAHPQVRDGQDLAAANPVADGRFCLDADGSVR